LTAGVAIGSIIFLISSAAGFAQSTNGTAAGPANSQFQVRVSDGAIVSLRRAKDSVDTDYLAGRRLGDVAIKYRRPGGDWRSVETGEPTLPAQSVLGRDATEYKASYRFTNDAAAALEVEMNYRFQDKAVLWTMTLQNLSSQPLEVGDLAVPVPIGARGGPRGGGGQRTGGAQGTNAAAVRGGGAGAQGTNAITGGQRGGGGGQRGGTGAVILKHSFISGNGSFLFWMREARSSIVGPYLTMVPTGDTSLEYWEAGFGGYRVFIHSAVSGAAARTNGTNWRQPNTSLALAPNGKKGDRQTYGFKFVWADDYDAVRQILVDEGKIDVQVVPGMTLPSDLSAEFALRTKQKIKAIDAEFPKQTQIESLGAKGDTHLYKVKFSKLGENRLLVLYGDEQHVYLEFFSSEPLETLIKKRAAFIAHSQHRDPTKWYDGLITEWAMDKQLLLSPDNYDRIRGFRIYAVTCDDAGLGHPAYLAAKNAEYPDQKEVEALDYYIQHFVWGGLQRTTNETYSYGVYGIPDWKKNRDSAQTNRNGQLHLWRPYDYPHVIQMYLGMYRVAKYHPEIRTALSADEYLRRTFGTTVAMFTVPTEIEGREFVYGTGFYNEIVIPDLINELEANGWKDEAAKIRGYWERKVKNFVNGRMNLFQSEYAFDSTGFESTAAFARYAMLHADRPGGEPVSGIPLTNAVNFMQRQLDANIFCRGWLEPAYYYLGSDYRGGGGNGYTLSYMAQMGGWGVLDYALNFATNFSPYLRLGYASSLSSWALVNSGTKEADYGYWYPGEANDGAAGGGFEPAPFGQTWLGQPHHRGSWYYACEIDLGYCGALRCAATVLTDDPIFGRVCLGGDWQKKSGGLEVIPRDGLRRRFHAMLGNGKVHFISDTDRFASGQPIVLKEDLSELRFQLESDNPAKHTATLRLTGLKPGRYAFRDDEGVITNIDITDGRETMVEVRMGAGLKAKSFVVQREG
jgi:hypothetical protein